MHCCSPSALTTCEPRSPFAPITRILLMFAPSPVAKFPRYWPSKSASAKYASRARSGPVCAPENGGPRQVGSYLGSRIVDPQSAATFSPVSPSRRMSSEQLSSLLGHVAEPVERAIAGGQRVDYKGRHIARRAVRPKNQSLTLGRFPYSPERSRRTHTGSLLSRSTARRTDRSERSRNSAGEALQPFPKARPLAIARLGKRGRVRNSDRARRKGRHLDGGRGPKRVIGPARLIG